MKIKNSGLYLILLLIIGGSLLTGLRPHTLFGDWEFQSVPLHSTVEAVPAMAAILMALLLLQREEEDAWKFFAPAIGFIGMGILDSIHAITSPGQSFVLLRAISSLIGGFWFALVWLPSKTFVKSGAWKKWIPPGMAAASFSFSILVLMSETLPEMVRNGEFTSTAVAINFIAGILFIAGAIYFLRDFRTSGRMDTYLFACMALLFGLAGLMFQYSALWDDAWWFWHVYRLTAFLLVFLFINIEHMGMLSAQKISLAKRMLAEEEVKKSEALLQLQINRMPIGCIFWDTDFRAVSWNPAAEGIFGFKAGEAIGKQSYDLIVPREAQPNVDIIWKRLLEGDTTAHSVNENITKDGRTIICSWSNTPLKENGAVIGVLSMVQDVTERRRAEAALKESEERFRLMVENVKDYAIFMLSPEGNVVSWNAGAEHIKGYKAEEILGKHYSCFYSAEDIEQGKPEQHLKIAASEGRVESEGWRIRKDGLRLWGNVVITALRDEHGELRGFTKVTRDITERKKAEEALQDAHRRLSVLYTIDRAASQSLELNEILSNAMDATLDALRIEAGGIVLLEPDDETLTLRIHRGLSEEFVRNLQHFSVGEGVSGRAVAERKPVVLDVSEYPTARLAPVMAQERLETIASTPLISGGKAIGALTLGTKRVRAFPPEEMNLLTSIGLQLGLVIRNALLHEKVQQSEEKYRLLIENIQDGIFIIQDAKMKYVNEAFAKMLGYTVEEVIGKDFRELVVPEDLEMVADRYQRRQAGEEVPREYEFRMLHKDGKTRIIVNMSVGLIDYQGRIASMGTVKDVTERKRAEDALKQSEEKYRALMKDAGDAIFIADAKGNILEINKEAEKLTGYTKEEILNMHLAKLHPEDELERITASFKETFQKCGTGSLSDIHVVRKDGKTVPVDLTGSVIEYANMRVAQAIMRDITDRKRAEEALLWEAGINASIAELSTALISMKSIDEISSIVLEHAKRLTGSKFGYIGYIDLHAGYLISPTLTRDIWNACNVKDKNIIFKKFTGLWGWVLNNRKPLLTNTPANDARSSGTPEGHVPIHRFISAPAMIGETLVGQISLANAYRDYNEQDLKLIERLATIYAIALQRKQIEDALETALDNWQDTFNAISDSVFILDSEGRIVLSNGAFERKFGVNTEDVVGQHCHNIVHGALDFIEDCPFKRMMQTGMRDSLEFEDKEHGLWFYVTVDPIYTKAGEITNAVHIMRDITELKKAEETRHENERLAYASKTKSDFLASMSHELRTPLNAILGFSELMIQKIPGELNEMQEGYVSDIYASGTHLLNLINDILDLSKVEAGKIELAVEKLSVPQTVNEGFTLVKEKAMKHNITLKTELDPELEFIEADKQRFKQVLFNLLSNAVKFSKPGGGIVTVKTGKEGEMARISVSDTGIGIKEDDMVKLFKEFEQIDSGISRKYGGTGLGLAISKKLVELHGGKIMAESRFGEGSTFTILLPIKAKKREENR